MARLPSDRPHRLRRPAAAVADFFADLAYGARRSLRRARGGLRGLWSGRSLRGRRYVAAGLLVLGVAAVVRFVPIPGIPCEFGARECSQPDHAVGLVPGDAQLYLHIAAGGGGQADSAAALFRRLPDRDLIVQTVLDSSAVPRRVSFRKDVAPWLGDEAALAVLPHGEEFVLGVADRKRAEAFLQRLGGSKPTQAKYRNRQLLTYKGPGRLAATFIGDLLVVGSPIVVKRAIDVHAGKTDSLAEAPAAKRVRDSLPDSRFADLYVSGDGVSKLLAASRGGGARQLETFVNYAASEGFAVAAVAHESGLEVDLTSGLDPKRAKLHPSFFSAFEPFHPTLASELSPKALSYVGFDNLEATIQSLLKRAAAASPGIAKSFDRFNRQVERSGKISLRKDVLPLLRGEVALAAEPGPPVPHVTLVVSGVDEKKATEALAALQAPIAKAINPGRNLQAPVFREEQVKGVTVRSVQLSPTVDLSYATTQGKLVVSTDPSGVKQAIEAKQSLAGADVYKQATDQLPDPGSAVIFLNLDQLLGLAEQVGLAEDPGYSSFRDDIRTVKSLGLGVLSENDKLETKLFLTIQESK